MEVLVNISRALFGFSHIGSSTFNEVFKSIGIPARAVSGYTFAETSFGGHQWAEVELDGKWMPIDPIQGIWADDSPYHLIMNEEKFKLIKNIKFELVEVKLNNGENIVIKEGESYDVKY